MAQAILQRMVVTGGGTGGHLFPGIALAQAVLSEYPDSSVLFIGTQRHLDGTTLERLGLATTSIPCRGLKGTGILSRIRTLLELPVSLYAAARILTGFKPDLVFGVGGYVTGPVVLAARLLKIPTCIHEQNSIPGLANRMLGRIAHAIFVSLPGSERFFPAGKTVRTGNPVRREILELAKMKTDTGKESRTTLLVLGGSQGAHRINTLMVEAMECVREQLPPNFQVIHQTGTADEEMVKAAYSRLGIEFRVGAFFQNMAEVYGESDVVISRAGATTLAELMVVAKPAILIPYPYAADNHQEENGRYLTESNGALMFRERELDGKKLGRELLALIGNKSLRIEMAGAMTRLATPDATQKILRECLELLSRGKGRFATAAG